MRLSRIFHPGFLCILLFVMQYSQSYAQAPAVGLFSPVSGSIGTVVTINGNNFNPTAASNIVYFGGMKAAVSAASATSLTVTVPRGAGNQPITVTNLANNLTGYSQKAFLVTFPGGDQFFNTSSFGNEVQLVAGTYPKHAAIGDVDNDGKPDIVCISDPGGSAYYLSTFRNTTALGVISFAPKIESLLTGYGGNGVILADIDGDGLLDVVVSYNENITVYRNLSIPGSISYATRVDLSTGVSTPGYKVQAMDIDKDGKTDLVYGSGGGISVMKNNSTPGVIAMLPPVVIVTKTSNTTSDEQVKITDLDGDAKPDFAVTYPYIDSMYIIRNLSTPGSMQFDLPVKYSTGTFSHPMGISIADIDNDLLPDVVVSCSGNDKFSVYKNVSTAGSMVFTPFYTYSGIFVTNLVATGDLNGDGRQDLVANVPGFSNVAVFRNFSTPCKPVIDSRVDFEGDRSRDLQIADINGDGKPELIVVKDAGNFVKIYKNNVGQSVTICANTNTSIQSSFTSTTYQWQQSTGAAFSNISNGANFNGTTTGTLQLINVPVSWNGYKYRCVVDADTSNVFSVFVNASLTPALTISNCPTTICPGGSTSFTAIPANGGVSPAYQWQDSVNISGWANIPGATNSTLNYNLVSDSTRIRCTLTSSYTCASPATVTSNTILLRITPNVTPAVTIAGNNTVLQGQSSVLTATPVNGGTIPFYQWQDSTSVASWTNIAGATYPTLTYFPAQTGHKVRCLLKSNANCATVLNVISNAIVFTVNPVTAVNPVPLNQYGIVIFPNPANQLLHIDSLKISDKWQSVEITATDGKTHLLSYSIKGVSRISLNISTLPKGMYLVIFRNQYGRVAYQKLVKL